LKPIATFGSEFSYTALDSGYILYITPAGALKTRNSGGFTPDTTATINYNEDVVVGFTVSGTTVNFYVNGLFVESETIASGTFNVDRLFNGGVASSSYRADGLIESVVIFDKALTAAEIAVLTSELNESIPDQEVASKVIDKTDKSYGFNGSSSFAALSSALTLRYDKDWNIEFFFKPEGIGDDMVLMGSTPVASGYVCRFEPVSKRDIYPIFDGVASTNVSFSSEFSNGNTYKIVIDYESSTQTGDITRINLSTGESETLNADYTALGNFSLALDLFGKRGGNNRYLNGLLSSVKITIDGTVTRFFDSDYGALTPTDITVQRGFDIVDFHLKGEMHALANERTITSGFLENTGLIVDSGSFKIITETVFSTTCKVIECVTNGELLVPTTDESTANWKGWINTGVSYALNTGFLPRAKVIRLNAGNKLIWSSENHLYDLYQET
jgi:hypothetical protein